MIPLLFPSLTLSSYLPCFFQGWPDSLLCQSLLGTSQLDVFYGCAEAVSYELKKIHHWLLTSLCCFWPPEASHGGTVDTMETAKCYGSVCSAASPHWFLSRHECVSPLHFLHPLYLPLCQHFNYYFLYRQPALLLDFEFHVVGEIFCVL